MNKKKIRQRPRSLGTHPSDARNRAKRTKDRLPEPPQGWERALTALVLEGNCPRCGRRISDPTVDADGLTWSCLEGCNP